MDKVTHTIDIKIGVDYSVLFSPENINGVKLLLDAKSDQDVINSYAADVVSKISTALSGDFVEVLTGEITPVQTDKEDDNYIEEMVSEPTQDFDSENEDVAVESWTEDELPDNFVEISEENLDLLQPNEEPIMVESNPVIEDDEKLNEHIKLLDIINDKLFSIISYMGKEIEVFVRGMNGSPVDFKKQLRDQQCEVYDMEFIIDEISDPEADYIISYEKADGEESIEKGKLDMTTEGAI